MVPLCYSQYSSVELFYCCYKSPLIFFGCVYCVCIKRERQRGPGKKTERERKQNRKRDLNKYENVLRIPDWLEKSPTN